MHRSTRRWLTLSTLAALTFAAAYTGLRMGHLSRIAAAPAAPMHAEPLTMLWAWESPQDLSSLNPSQAGIAFLSRELLIHGPAPGGDPSLPASQIEVRPRMQPLHPPSGAWLMAVVRIETSRTAPFTDTPALRAEAATDILAAAQAPGIRALQIDFDAALTERAFYAALIRDVRSRLPAAMPLSITALTSWCATGGWLQAFQSSDGQPLVDEAVPMFFRMGGPSETRATMPRSEAVIADPSCAGSAGVSTDEAWPDIHPGERIYLFRTGPWTAADIARINTGGYTALQPKAE